MLEIISNLGLGFAVALTAKNLLLCFLGCLIGTLIGVLPGVGPIATIAMLLPITFGLDPIGALISQSTGAPQTGPAAPAAAADLWVEVAEIDDVSSIGSMRLFVPGEGPIELHSKPKGARLVQSARLGPFRSEARASASLSRALAAGFGAARIVRGAGE